MDQLTELFEKLKETNKLPPAEREEIAANALDIVDTLRASVQYFATTDSSQGFSRDLILREANDAVRTLHLLSKFHRQLPPAPLLPHLELYNNPNRKPLAPETAFDKLKLRAGLDIDFAEFIMFADHTATLFVDANRSSQAQEVLELIERRLLKQKQRSERFRAYVTLLMEGRRHAGIEPRLASTEEGRRQLKWYASDHGMGDGVDALARLDAFFGYKLYLRLPHVQSMESPVFERFGQLGGQHATDDMPMICVENAVASGAETREQLDKIHTFLLDMAKQSGLRFIPNKCEVAVKSIEIWGFRFSEKEIMRA